MKPNTRKPKSAAESRKQPAKQPISPIPSHSSNSLIFNGLFQKQTFWKRLYFVLCGLTLALMLAIVPQMGCGGDEVYDGTNGRAALAYYVDGDTSFANYPASQWRYGIGKSIIDSFMKYYGTGFEILPAIAERYLGMSAARQYDGIGGYYTFELRHALGALFGVLGMFFAGLIGRRLRNWQTACLCLLVMALTPTVFGYSFFASKDIPGMAGFAMAVYAFLCIYQALPKFRVRDCLLAVAGIGLAVSIRIGGLLLPLYFAAGLLMVFCFNKTLRQTLLGNIPLMARTAGICAGIAIAGALLGLCFYPNFFYEGPFDHIKNAFGMVSAHPEHIKFMWEGTLEDSQNLPPFYLAKAYLYTIPLFVLGGAALFLLNIRRIAWECSVFQICFLVFTVAFPIAYIVLGKAHLYNGWRHTLFVYPTFAPLAAIGLYEMGNVFSKKNLWGKLGRWAYRAAAVAAILPVAKWTAQNYKYAYSSYYNELAGNIRGRFDQDIYSTAEVLSFRWLLQNRLTDATRQYTICVKGGPVSDYAAAKQMRNINFIKSGMRGYAAAECDYAIMNSVFVPRKVLDLFYHPRKPIKGAIHYEKVGSNPICVVMEKYPADAKGVRLAMAGRYGEALPILEDAYNYNPNNFGLWQWLGLAYYYNQKYDDAIKFLTRSSQFWPAGDEVAFNFAHIGAAQVEKKEYDNALHTLGQAAQASSSNPQISAFIAVNMGVAHYHKKQYAQALPYLESALGHYPHLRGLVEFCRARAK